LILLITYASGWQFSASYISAYLYDFLILVFGATLVSLILASALHHVLSARIGGQSDRPTPSEMLRRFLTVTTILYVPVLLAFLGLNGLGLPWYAPDVSVPLMYFFVLLTGIFFVVHSIILAVISQVLCGKMIVKNRS